MRKELSQRLGRGLELDLLFKSGRRLANALFQCTVRANDLAHNRFVFVVARAVDKRATQRNRLRRRCREYMRTHIPYTLVGRDIAVVVKKNAIAASRKEFYDSLGEILRRIP